MSLLCKSHPRVQIEITSGHGDHQARVRRFLVAQGRKRWLQGLLIRGSREVSEDQERGPRMSLMLSQQLVPHPGL